MEIKYIKLILRETLNLSDKDISFYLLSILLLLSLVFFFSRF